MTETDEMATATESRVLHSTRVGKDDTVELRWNPEWGHLVVLTPPRPVPGVPGCVANRLLHTQGLGRLPGEPDPSEGRTEAVAEYRGAVLGLLEAEVERLARSEPPGPTEPSHPAEQGRCDGCCREGLVIPLSRDVFGCLECLRDRERAAEDLLRRGEAMGGPCEGWYQDVAYRFLSWRGEAALRRWESWEAAQPDTAAAADSPAQA